MKILVWAAADVKGSAPVDLTLPPPETREGFNRNVAVIAVPVPDGRRLTPARLSGADRAQHAKLSDGDPSTSAKFPPSAAGHRLEIVCDSPPVVRLLQAAVCGPHRWEENTPFALKVSDDGQQFRPAGSFTVNWDCPLGDVTTAAFDDATGRVFRMAFTNAWPIQIGELTLNDAARVHFAAAKAGRLRSRDRGAEARHHRAYRGPESGPAGAAELPRAGHVGDESHRPHVRRRAALVDAAARPMACFADWLHQSTVATCRRRRRKGAAWSATGSMAPWSAITSSNMSAVW